MNPASTSTLVLTGGSTKVNKPSFRPSFYKQQQKNKILAKKVVTSCSTQTSSGTASSSMSNMKSIILENSYLGKKGYTIPKEHLSAEELATLYKDLVLKPETFGGPSFGKKSDDDEAFPVYRENSKKIYIPRFYGIDRYGLPAKTELQSGVTINVQFEKPLRDYQDKIIKVYTDYVLPTNSGGAILEVPCGRGKTVMALKIISLLHTKTLIIVHKEFLMNQWIERIAEFLPSAKVGKIQGPIFDIEGKDIVIGMLQTLYDREFEQVSTGGDSADAFQSFGLTIIDEVHRIGSQQFSKALLRIMTPYMLGISATVERKDGLTKLLYMFIGPKIYSEERDDQDPVCVRAIEYISPDAEFNETVTDFRGQTQYSSMITKLCAFGPRSDFIVRVIKDLFIEGDMISAMSDNKKGRPQVMVLAHNRSLLTYFYQAIVHQGFATVGYYVGGMKQAALNETETKEVVLATYAMAAEALDIKSLSILVMATPKTDIVQSVGRILRIRHENPVIVDIVDKHDVFQNQWRQRKTFYRKCDYRIRSIQSPKYMGMAFDWKKDYSWIKVFDPRKNIVVGTNTNSEKKEYKCLIQVNETDLDD